MAVVGYKWMFRAAAVVYLLLGLGACWRFGFTDYDPRHRPWGMGLGLAAVLIGIFLLRRVRAAIAISAVGALFVALAASVAVPAVHGPVILAFASLALLAGAYAALAGRVLLQHGE